MIRSYFLPVETINDVETIAGSEQIHDALVLTTEHPMVRLVIQDTTESEHDYLAMASLEFREPTEEEIVWFWYRYHEPPPSADTLRAEEILATSPAVISMPEMWELVRIFGKRLGFRF